MDVYLEEYSADDAIARYTSRTAGHGISYLLEHDYAEIYLSAIDRYLRLPPDQPLQLLEFGCGGGMNLITLVSLLERKGRKVEIAVGTDFSDRLIEAANLESKTLLNPEQQKKTHFAVARNETIAADLQEAFPGGEGASSFHVILGVNTFRYCHRLGKADECARDLAALLEAGGICIMIDMNRKFPAFRSKFRDKKTKPEAERYLPSLDEYANPFANAGLEILRKENFCWIPHSASARLTNVCRLLSPVLDVVAKPRAMRSLVVSRKAI
ncbi:MAG: class I SAM-dependent methyltransferase [Chthoniobacterales bacterium]